MCDAPGLQNLLYKAEAAGKQLLGEQNCTGAWSGLGLQLGPGKSKREILGCDLENGLCQRCGFRVRLGHGIVETETMSR